MSVVAQLMKSFRIFLLIKIYQGSSDGRGIWLELGRREIDTGFWYWNLKERDRFGDPGVDGREYDVISYRDGIARNGADSSGSG
jgi:hypothetical protein